MSYRELSMIEVREILRRRQAGQSIRQITRETGIDRKTVRRYFQCADDVGLGAADALDHEAVHLVAQGVQARTVPPPSEPRQELAPHRDRIATWLAGTAEQRPLRLTKVHTLLARQGVDVTYATLRRFAIDELDWRKPKPTVRLDDPAPGLEAQVDFGYMGLLFDPESGRKRKLWVLVVTLSHSRHSFVWPTFRQTTEALCEGLDEAWWFFGGMPTRIIPDNMSAAVTKADRTAPVLNEAFADYVQERGLYVDLARVRKPQDKARVENEIAYVRESWWDGEHFDDIATAREDAARWCRETAGLRVHGTTREVPIEAYESRERPHMRPAPEAPFDVPIWTDAKVHPDHHLSVARALYSVPTRWIGRTMRARADRAIVRVYWGTELVKVHERQPPGGRSTDPADYPTDQADAAFRKVDWLIERARAQGEHVGIFAHALLDRPLPWTVMRQGYHLLSLCDRFGAERVDAMCARAIDFECYEVKRIDRMLRDARRVEDGAERQGKLRGILSAPRFARTAESFGTRGKEGA